MFSFRVKKQHQVLKINATLEFAGGLPVLLAITDEG